MNDKIKYVYDTPRKFKFKKFFSYSGKKSNGASVIITPRQVLTTPNIYNYKGYHLVTQCIMIDAIYNPLDIDGVDHYRFREKAIRMDLISEGTQKKIMIYFPEEITREQIDLLQAYQNTYGDIVEGISKEYVQVESYYSPVVSINIGNYHSIDCHSFEEAIKYAENLPRVETQDTPEETIIGQVISLDGLTLCNSSELRSLGRVSDMALDKGVTPVECKDSSKHFKDLPDRTGGNRE